MTVQVVPLDFHAMVDRLQSSYNYEAAVMGLVSGDADPTSEMNVWLSSGETHLWHPNQAKPANAVGIRNGWADGEATGHFGLRRSENNCTIGCRKLWRKRCR